MKIGEFSKKVSLSIDTLRYYEKIGLIYPKRDENNIREYNYDDFKWVESIKN
ncbi:MerR family DNA-binding transcriptional regulator [Apilactobacillus micheneri]|uniref:MerR family DNA-binding transcriptional regulator n=1 Tax=Apilactobacillus micheneri TaxID=1899430 RepID=UPI001CDB05C2|nr:MerR family DNA-binding transcriptional regulator [Apilactobacillus micheneri]